MKFRTSVKTNLFLIFVTLLCLAAVNGIKIRNKQAEELDDWQKRDILMKMSDTFIFQLGDKMTDKFRKCIDDKDALTTFYNAVPKKEAAKVLNNMGYECYKPGFILQAKEEEVQRTLKVLIDQITVKYAAVDGIISSHRNSISFNAGALNFTPKK